MATVSEIMDSRMGGGVGAFGSQAMTTLWTVVVDDADDDPIQTMWETAGAPNIGSLFPSLKTPWQTRKDRLVAIGFNYSRKIAPKVYEIVVTYGPPVFIETHTDAWEIAVSASLTQELLFHDLDGRPIGPLHYSQVPSETGQQPPTPAGHDMFKAKAPTGELFWISAESPPSGHDNDDPTQRPPDDRGRYVTGANRTLNVGRLVMTRAFPNMPQDVLYTDTIAGTSALGTINRVNSDQFKLKVDFGYGSDVITFADPFTCKIVDGVVNKEFGSMLGQREPGAIWRVTFSIEFNPLTWWYHNEHTFPWEGAQLPIRSHDDSRVIERHRLYDFMNFTSYFSRFG